VNAQAGWTAEGRALLTGDAAGEALVLADPLSFWGGVDPVTGAVIDARHPQRGECVAGRVLVMPAGRGSSSSSSVLAETLRSGTGPAAVLLAEPDEIVVLGALVVGLLDGVSCPVIVLQADAYRRLRTGDRVVVDSAGVVRVGPSGGES
jgi:predicted aconitase with swiveling domain